MEEEERDPDINGGGYRGGGGQGRDPTIISMFRHPLGDPSNPDLSSHAWSAARPPRPRAYLPSRSAVSCF